MKIFKQFLVALVASIGLSANAGSYSDLWWNPNENGWGINLIQQHDTIFATMFVYGPDGKTSWYVASALKASNATGTTFTGDLFETTGPYFGSGFNPSAVTVRKVGTMTFAANEIGLAAALNYTVDGLAVTKSIVRQTWTTIPVNAIWFTAIARVPGQGDCPGLTIAGINTVTTLDPGVFRITTASPGTSQVCQISGQLRQDGQLKALTNASITCSSPSFTGTALVADWRMEGDLSSFLGTLPSQRPRYMTGQILISGPSSCTGIYYFSGVRTD
jgi:hypothetical protein